MFVLIYLLHDCAAVSMSLVTFEQIAVKRVFAVVCRVTPHRTPLLCDPMWIGHELKDTVTAINVFSKNLLCIVLDMWVRDLLKGHTAQ